MSQKQSQRSLRLAINKKCKECIYDKSAPGTWIDQVSRCTSYDCPLYRVRPGQDRKQKKLPLK